MAMGFVQSIRALDFFSAVRELPTARQAYLERGLVIADAVSLEPSPDIELFTSEGELVRKAGEQIHESIRIGDDLRTSRAKAHLGSKTGANDCKRP
jgi:hypothetical protein